MAAEAPKPIVDASRRMLRKLLFALVASFLMSIASARAEITVEAYLKKDPDLNFLNSVWLFGVQSGFAWANAENVNHGRPPMYCQPEHLTITRGQTISILDDFIKKNPALPIDTEISLVLLLALQDAFPCPH
jgi:hypothetical protein